MSGPSKEAIEAAREVYRTQIYSPESLLEAAYPIVQGDVAREIAEWLRTNQAQPMAASLVKWWADNRAPDPVEALRDALENDEIVEVAEAMVIAALDRQCRLCGVQKSDADGPCGSCGKLDRHPEVEA